MLKTPSEFKNKTKQPCACAHTETGHTFMLQVGYRLWCTQGQDDFLVFNLSHKSCGSFWAVLCFLYYMLLHAWLFAFHMQDTKVFVFTYATSEFYCEEMYSGPHQSFHRLQAPTVSSRDQLDHSARVGTSRE